MPNKKNSCLHFVALGGENLAFRFKNETIPWNFIRLSFQNRILRRLTGSHFHWEVFWGIKIREKRNSYATPISCRHLQLFIPRNNIILFIRLLKCFKTLKGKSTDWGWHVVMLSPTVPMQTRVFVTQKEKRRKETLCIDKTGL